MANYPNFEMTKRSDCRICGSTDLVSYLDLGEQPPSNAFIAANAISQEQTFPLKVYFCQDCGLSQLLHIVSARSIFDDYVYLSSTSKALCNHYQRLVDSALSDFNIQDSSLIVDIGCNDGIMLERYPKNQYQLLGIEPSSAGKFAEKAGFRIIDKFFDSSLSTELKSEFGKAHIITATNVFAHVDDIHSFTSGINELLAPQGVFIIEFPYLGDMLENLYFDTVYHEHLCYFGLTPLIRLLNDNCLRAFRVEKQEMGASGPALRLFVCHQSAGFDSEPSIGELLEQESFWGITESNKYMKFGKDIAQIKKQIVGFIDGLLEQGKKLGAFGAPAKGNTLLNFLELSKDQLSLIAENNDLKIGLVTPGSHIPIVSDQEFLESGISHALLLSWNYAEFFLNHSEFVKHGGKFIVPFPAPRIAP
jgi:SAM-dependent methyltransferase